jgi:chondroitin-sulfate-ABC endolyase/exolyase
MLVISKRKQVKCVGMIKLFLLVGISLITFNLNAQKWSSFEADTIPSEWNNASAGTSVKLSAKHSKIGNQSLQWDWKPGSFLTVNNPNDLKIKCKNGGSGLYAWVYNENPIKDSLTIEFLNVNETYATTIKMYLNFKGWRCISVAFKADANYAYAAGRELMYMRFKAPKTGASGNLFFDMVDITNSVPWNRTADYFVKTGTNVRDFITPRELQADLKKINLADTSIANAITKKLDEWMLGSAEANIDQSLFNKRIQATNQWISWSKFGSTANAATEASKIVLTRNDDGSVCGKRNGEGVGLFSIGDRTEMNFSKLTQGTFLQLALDFRLHPETPSGKASLQRCIDLFDWAYDQGWADSSAMGILYLNPVRTTAWPHAFFLLRNYLPASTYTNTLNALRWFTQFGHTYAPFKVDMDSKNADDIRGEGVAKLIYALTEKDPKIKVASLQGIQKFYNFAFQAAPGYHDIFKVDFSTFHHAYAYTSEYGDDALHQACLIYYLFAKTPLQLNTEVYEQLKGTLLRYDLFSANHRTPSGTSGRFPSASKNMQELLPAYLYLGLSANKIDTALIATFKRLYQLDPQGLQDFWFSKPPIVSISLTKTLGASKCILQALNMNIVPNSEASTTTFMPYSGLFIGRKNGWLATVKGFSKYISGFECITNDGRYGRYLGYGNFELSSSSYQKQSFTPSNSWDWSHFPGTTAKALTMAQLDASKGGLGKMLSNWNYGDDPFLGGTSLNDSVSMCAMQLHDATFDQSFEAKKSYFYFGNVIYFMGSGIKNNDAASSTHTTLFQNITVQPTEEVYVNENAVTNYHEKVAKPTAIKDNWNNVYLVYPSADAMLTVNKRVQEFPNYSSSNNMPPSNYVTGWIDHGTKPTNGKYNYALLLQPSNSTVNKAINNGLIDVKQQNDTAHIIYNKQQNVFAYSLFTPTTITLSNSEARLKQVYQPCMVMEQANGNNLTISFSDPDLHMAGGAEKGNSTTASAPVVDSIDVVGNYTLIATLSNIKASYLKKENITRILITAVDGMSYRFQLSRLPANKPSLNPKND